MAILFGGGEKRNSLVIGINSRSPRDKNEIRHKGGGPMKAFLTLRQPTK
jgi:hypothetical protein